MRAKAFPGWDIAIKEAQERVRQLKAAIKTFRQNRDSGREWPGFKSLIGPAADGNCLPTCACRYERCFFCRAILQAPASGLPKRPYELICVGCGASIIFTDEHAGVSAMFTPEAKNEWRHNVHGLDASMPRLEMVGEEWRTASL